jgi:hypothetical protein
MFSRCSIFTGSCSKSHFRIFTGPGGRQGESSACVKRRCMICSLLIYCALSIRKKNCLIKLCRLRRGGNKITMIKAEELRVNNIYMHRSTPDALTIHHKLSAVCNSDEWNPIPLTPEWLERCGFAKGDAYDIEHDIERGEEHYWHNDRLIWRHRLKNKRVDECYDHINCLHQLQNLYFALTGEELKIEL